MKLATAKTKDGGFENVDVKNSSVCNRSEIPGIRFVDYSDESQLDHVMSLVASDLSEPYSIFTYRYFLHRFPELCILAVPEDDPENPIGCIVGKVDEEDRALIGTADEAAAQPLPNNNTGKDKEAASPTVSVGYLGMLAVDKSSRRQGIGRALVRRVLDRMRKMGCDSVILETEVSNTTAQRLYQDTFGFIREELLVRYYLNWNDAYRLRLWFS